MKKRPVRALLALLIIFCAPPDTMAFTFPTPDWGAVLKERTAMVREAELELYTEGAVGSAPYYGARLEPRGGAYIGMTAETSEGFYKMGSYLTYIQGMTQNYIYYPANNIIRDSDAVAMIGWTVTDADVDYNAIRNTLDMLSQYKKPMFIRFANEMDQFPIGDDPELYKQIFRNVADMVHEYPNFATVWSPLDLGALDRPFQYYYPGDEYVDWVAVSCYTKKYFIGNRNVSANDAMYFMTGDGAWATNRVKPFMKFLSDYNINKPVMISEGGVAVTNKYGEELSAWSAPRLRNMLWYLVMKYPQIKMINYFNVYRDDEPEHFYMSGLGYACDIFNEASEDGPYIHSAYGTPGYVFCKASAGETLRANSEGVIPLYTLAYIYQAPDISVNYYLDGNWYSSASEIPYKTYLDCSRIADGEHTLRISAAGQERSYKLYKSGRNIRFGAWPEAEPAADMIKVVLNRRTLSFEQPPVIVNDRTLVPLRAIFEALNADVNWDGDNQTITSTRNGTTVIMQINNTLMYCNGAYSALDTAPQLINGYTMIPVRAVAEAFGCAVSWDGDVKTVYISE